MTLPEITPSSDRFPGSAADAAVLVIPDPAAADGALDGYPGLADALAGIGFKGTASAFARLHLPEVSPVPLAVVSTGRNADAGAVRDAVGTAVRSLTGYGTVAIGFAPGLEAYADAAAEGALLGGYRFDDYRSEKKPGKASALVLHAALDETALTRARAVAEAVALVKDLVSVPAEWQSPADLAASAAGAVAGLPVDVRILDEKELEEQGYGGIIGVGRGSDRPPRLVRLDYSPAAAVRHIALVGKGITFDTGGLSLKPAASMVGMKFDMAGAATVLAVLRGIAELALPVRVTAWMCIADNMPSGRATRPGDVLRMLDGQTVEVLNTDAEGRLVLADGLVAASREKPDVIVDVATLTGAILVALGKRHTGVMGEDEAVREYLEAAAATGEPAWALPLPDYMEESLDSQIADMVNANMGDRSGGSLFAGLFLRRFVGRTSQDEDAPRIPWVHLDIAGSAEHSGSPYGFTEKGPTGAAVRSLIAFAEASAAASAEEA
ncbi:MULTISPECIES: leucyl aminopeptidase [Microbacterium]|uniref:leucyl aminopeptidase n=1 Tax=Microbacterium TaxID=33882 RepID=UPI00217DC9F3|nr:MULTISPECIES: leucyl aminopeptidase [Microbacterium]UWF78549.1 leucyl aminopeptidase [Microbacterium neungamense]WCM54634.1 leucyl aminopeptidase [Microbacterium sp. EF45047]